MNEINNFIAPAKAFYEIILDGIVITSLSGKVEYWNSSAYKLLKCENKLDLKNKLIDQCFNDSNFLNEVLRELVPQKNYITTKNCTRTDGVKEDFVLCISLLANSENEPIGLQIIFKNPNISSDGQSYFENRSSLLSSLNYQSREIILISDLKEKRNVFCSKSVEKIVGWSQIDFIDGGWAFAVSLTHPEDLEKIAIQFTKEIDQRTRERFVHDHKPIVYEYRKRHKNGSWVNIHSETLILERDENQDPHYLITFLKDVKPEKESVRAEQEKLNTSIEIELTSLLIPGKSKSNINSVHLSKREKEILQLVRAGHSTKEIADILKLKIASVNSYRKNLMVKMNAKNTAELVEKSNHFIIN